MKYYAVVTKHEVDIMSRCGKLLEHIENMWGMLYIMGYHLCKEQCKHERVG